MNTKKKVITLVVVVVTMLVVIASTLAIVLTLSNQSLESQVNIAYTAEDVAVRVSASVYRAGDSAETKFVNGSKEYIDITPTNRTATLSQASGSVISLDDNHTSVCIAYIFQTLDNSVPVKISLTAMPTIVNMKVQYYVSESYVDGDIMSYNDMELVNTLSDQILEGSVSVSGNIAIYVVYTVTDVYSSASIKGDFGWNLSRVGS